MELGITPYVRLEDRDLYLYFRPVFAPSCKIKYLRTRLRRRGPAFEGGRAKSLKSAEGVKAGLVSTEARFPERRRDASPCPPEPAALLAPKPPLHAARSND
jgi:hypothetical protein